VRGIAIGIEIPSVSFEQRTKEASRNQWVVFAVELIKQMVNVG
jgi:hypothetical protein